VKSPQLPTLAAAVLRRLEPNNTNEALIGDLIEEYQHRHSPWWLWRQVLSAVTIGCYQEVRDHKWLTARAILTAIVCWSGLGPLYRLAVGQYYNYLVMTWPVMGWALFLLVAVAAPGVAIGWVVGRCYRQHQAAMVMAVALLPIVASLPEFSRQFQNVLLETRYVSAFVLHVQSTMLMTMSLLAGGFSVRPAQRRQNN
jgi:hypothetical protein